MPSQPTMDVVNQENLLRSASLSLIERLLLLDSCMARKAPSTMLKRAASLALLLKAKAGGAVLSQLRGIMEAITFARFVFGL